MKRKPGAVISKNGSVKFSVWAPFKEQVQVVLKDKKEPIDLIMDPYGYWEKEVPNIGGGALYKFKLDGENEFPDPASRSQPMGVHSWSSIVDPTFSWGDTSWQGIPLSEMIIYELHIGTFTTEGTFEAVIEKLDHLLELGINTIEILPISQFPGDRNWGYDGVYPYAAQHSYGGGQGLKKMVNACHQKGVAVILDVVYNHMGPEGNYLAAYGPYFTEKYQTPWGAALNFDDKYSDEVRLFFLENALMWLEEFHIDGLRLDAIHEIIDRGALHLLKELSLKVDELEEKTGRSLVLIAESDLNDIKIINSYEKGGFGLEGQWVDDFHHALHTLLTGEKQGYYKDYGKVENLAKAFKQAFIYDGAYSAFRRRKVGNSPKGLPSYKFIVSIQNHDQIGNRMLGERLSETLSFESLKLAAGVLISSPFVPMLFMGEEYAEDNPFQYFVSHGDPQLVKAVQEGRKREFKYFYDGDGEFQDPQGEETFQNSKLNWNFRENEEKTTMFKFYKHLLLLKKQGAFDAFKFNEQLSESNEETKILKVTATGEDSLVAFFNFNKEKQSFTFPKEEKEWLLIVASSNKEWGGPNRMESYHQGGSTLKLPGNSMAIFEHKNI